jgi:hypothetical protein
VPSTTGRDEVRSKLCATCAKWCTAKLQVAGNCLPRPCVRQLCRNGAVSAVHLPSFRSSLGERRTGISNDPSGPSLPPTGSRNGPYARYCRQSRIIAAVYPRTARGKRRGRRVHRDGQGRGEHLTEQFRADSRFSKMLNGQSTVDKARHQKLVDETLGITTTAQGLITRAKFEAMNATERSAFAREGGKIADG